MKRLFGIVVASMLFSLAIHALAAPLNYTNNTQVSINSPSTTFTITAGSVADALTVNATSVAVTLSSSTGGTFTLSSAEYDLTIASSSGGGTASISCTSGVASVTISQSSGQTTYAISPAASQCTTPSGGGGSGGGGGGPAIGVSNQYGTPSGGGGGSSVPVPIAPSSTTAPSSTLTSTSSLEAELNALLAELATLQAKANPSVSSSLHFIFTRNLSLGVTGADVKELQLFLIGENTGPAAGKLAVHGTTKNFGTLALNALKEFQKKEGIVPASGYFGPKTRAEVNRLTQ